MRPLPLFLAAFCFFMPGQSIAQGQPQNPNVSGDPYNYGSFSYGNSADEGHGSRGGSNNGGGYGNQGYDPRGSGNGSYSNGGYGARGGYDNGGYGYPRDGRPQPVQPVLPDRSPVRPLPSRGGWQARNLLQGPAALVKGVGASVWCVGKSSYALFHGVDNVADGFVATLLWPFTITIDSVVSTAAYLGVGTAHTITGGALVSDPPKQIEEMSAPIYCVLSDNMEPPQPGRAVGSQL